MKTKVICVILLSAFLAFPTNAKEYIYSKDNVITYTAEESWDKLISNLPSGISDEVDTLISDNSLTAFEEKSNIAYWFEKTWDELLSSLISHLPQFLPNLAMILLLAAARITTEQTSESLNKSFCMLCKLILSISIISSTFAVIDVANDYLNSLCSIMNLLTPVMQAVYLAEGSLTQMSLSISAIMLTVTSVGNINSNVMMPLVNILFTLSVVASVCVEVNLNGLTAAIRRLIMRLWQIITIGFSFMLGTQSVIASSADNLAAKTVRFALGSIIPMAGGVLAEAFNTVREGIGFIKTATGIGGIIVILLILIPGIAPLLIYKLFILIYIFAADLLKLSEAKVILEDVKGIVEIIIAIVLYTSLMFVFSIILFTKSQVG